MKARSPLLPQSVAPMREVCLPRHCEQAARDAECRMMPITAAAVLPPGPARMILHVI